MKKKGEPPFMKIVSVKKSLSKVAKLNMRASRISRVTQIVRARENQHSISL